MTPRLCLDERLDIATPVALTRERLGPGAESAVQAIKHTPAPLHSISVRLEISIRACPFEELEVDERSVARVVGGELHRAATLCVYLHQGEVKVGLCGARNHIDSLRGPVAVEATSGEREYHEVALIESGLGGFEHYCAERTLDVGSLACFPLEG